VTNWRWFRNNLILLAACAGPRYEWLPGYARTHPETADLAENSLAQGCPVVGAPAWPLRESFGRPSIRPGAESGSAVWRFELDRASSLEAVTRGDTVVRWDVVGRPTRGVAKAPQRWSLAMSDGFPGRVVQYLAAHPATPPRTAFLLFRGCPEPGLIAEAIRGSWGEPAEIRHTADTTRWIYGFGVEGQHEIITVVGDRVYAYKRVDWEPGGSLR
jgi:hypothetical protein